MPAKSPEDICRLFQHYMAEGDIDSVLSLYDPEAVFPNSPPKSRMAGTA